MVDNQKLAFFGNIWVRQNALAKAGVPFGRCVA